MERLGAFIKKHRLWLGGLCCALAAVICIPAGAVLYFPFACMGIAAGFMALIVQVLKNTFAQAVRMKDELDLTV